MINNVILWFVAMGWHLTRIVQGKPQYGRLSNTRFTLISFILVFLVAVYFRLNGIKDYQLDGSFRYFIIVSFTNYAVIYALAYLFSKKKSFSSPSIKSADPRLTCALLGASAVTDVAMTLSSILFSVFAPLTYEIAQMVLFIVCIKQYQRFLASEIEG